MIFAIGYEPYLDSETAKWLKERNVKWKVRWSFHDDQYMLIIDNEEDAIAFRLSSGLKSGRTGFVYNDVR